MALTGVMAALAAEGAAFREAWGLRSLDQKGPFRCYGDGERILVISGVGRVRCAAALAWLLSRYPAIADGMLVNTGIAGSLGHKAGSVHLIHRAVDTSTGRGYYPDILFSHPYGEAALYTVDAPADALPPGAAAEDLIDMEGAAFLQGAALWIPCHRVQVIKVVSDSLAPEKVDRDSVKRLMENAIPAVEYAARAVIGTDKGKNMGARMEVFAQIAERMRLTATQRAQLERAGRAWLLRHPGGQFPFPEDMEIPTDKQDRGRMLSVLLDRLWED